MAQTAQSSIRSQIISLKDDMLILPNVAVAEVVPYSESEPVSGKPDWFLGMLSWRARSIPLVSFESVCGHAKAEPVATSRIAVINVIGGHCDMQFYALLVNSIPRLIQATDENIKMEESEKEKGVLSRVKIEGVSAIIPDLDMVEKALCKVL